MTLGGMHKMLKEPGSYQVDTAVAAHNIHGLVLMMSRLDGWTIAVGYSNVWAEQAIGHFIVVGGTKANIQVAIRSPTQDWLYMTPG